MHSQNLTIAAIKTPVFNLRDDLFLFLKKQLKEQLKKQPIQEFLEGQILAITSKIVSLAEGQLVPQSEIVKDALVRQTADQYLCRNQYHVDLTLKDGLLIPSSGIDESNSASGHFILYPKDAFASAREIWNVLKQEFGLSNFGVILTDSHSTPLRQGVSGIALSHWGFRPTKSLVGHADIFGKPLKFTYVNIADALAAAAVFVMGEADNSTPLAIIGASGLEFCSTSSRHEIQIEPKDDMYFPLLKPFLKN